MAYKRKTVDLYDIEGWYQQGARYGWEPVTTEESWSAARDAAKLYRENERGTQFRIRHYRERIAQAEAAAEAVQNMNPPDAGGI